MKVLYRLAIHAYQQRISPHKGYRCAYSVTHGGPGCSGAVLSILEEKGLFSGWALIQQRFHNCDNAAKERREEKERRKRDRKSDNSACNPLNALDACGDVGDCIPSGKCDGPCDGPCDVSTSLRAIVSGIIRR
jgi:putative component of membrane protein insertase Oxa1/YidC/SpoIIIJ protein YidD